MTTDRTIPNLELPLDQPDLPLVMADDDHLVRRLVARASGVKVIGRRPTPISTSMNSLVAVGAAMAMAAGMGGFGHHGPSARELVSREVQAEKATAAQRKRQRRQERNRQLAGIPDEQP